MADLSAFPIIRLDQIKLVDKETLSQAGTEVEALLSSLRTDEPSSQMIFYLQKQLDSMKAEEVRRDAERRVSNLLAGIEDALGPQASVSISAVEGKQTTGEVGREPPAITTTTNHASVGVRQSTSAPTDVSKHSVAAAGFSPPVTPGHSAEVTSSSGSGYVPVRNRSAMVKPRSMKVEREEKKGGIEYISLATANDSDNNGSGDGDASHAKPPDQTTPARPLSATASSSSASKQLEKTKSNETPNAEERKKGSVDAYESVVKRGKRIEENEMAIRKEKQKKILNETFGNTFIVQSTHKKIRFFTKKVAVESPEAKLAREKDERKKAAMDRLLARQKQRQNLMENNAKRKRIIKSNTKKGKSAQILGTHQQFSAMDSDDSDSDTVSGGDDDDDDKSFKTDDEKEMTVLASSSSSSSLVHTDKTVPPVATIASNRMAEDKDKGKDVDREKERGKGRKSQRQPSRNANGKDIESGGRERDKQTRGKMRPAWSKVEEKSPIRINSSTSSANRNTPVHDGPRKVLIDGLVHFDVSVSTDFTSSIAAPSPNRPAPLSPALKQDKSMTTPVKEENIAAAAAEDGSTQQNTPQGFRVDVDVQEKCMSALDTLRQMKERKLQKERDLKRQKQEELKEQVEDRNEHPEKVSEIENIQNEIIDSTHQVISSDSTHQVISSDCIEEEEIAVGKKEEQVEEEIITITRTEQAPGASTDELRYGHENSEEKESSRESSEARMNMKYGMEMDDKNVKSIEASIESQEAKIEINTNMDLAHQSSSTQNTEAHSTFIDLMNSSKILGVKTLTETSIACSLGVDAIPGLAVWRLTHQLGDMLQQNKWEFSSSEWPKERDIERNLFEHRSTVVKQLPIGFVGLLFEMEEFLMDKHSHESENFVVQKWKEILKRFDERALSGFYRFPTDVFANVDGENAAYTARDENGTNDLKQMLNVCGNCYAACYKLKRLLQSPVEMFVKGAQHDQKSPSQIMEEKGDENGGAADDVIMDDTQKGADYDFTHYAVLLHPRVVEAIDERGLS